MYTINVRHVYTHLALAFSAIMIWRMARERLLITYKGRPSPLLENDRLPTLLG